MLKCKKCLYKTRIGGTVACGYCLYIGNKRNCEPENCDKFEPMNKKKRKEIDGSLNKVYASYSDTYIQYISEVTKKRREI